MAPSPMTKQSPLRAKNFVFAAVLILCQSVAIAQECSAPALVCPDFGTDTLNTSGGVPQALPPGFCFDEAPNALFFQFRTRDLVQFPGIGFDDASAALNILIDSCITDELYADGINLAVFEATNLCNAATYGEPLACATGITQSSQLVLSDLSPSTTYFVLLTGRFDPDEPDAVASECALNLVVGGGAVEYDISAIPPTPQSQAIFPGQTATLAINPIYEPVEWFGDALSDFEGATVIASPTEFGAYSYIVQAEINECIVQNNYLVTVVPPITPYNAFTPNNDGFNDTWVIDRIQQFPNAQIIVYSRWGSKVYQATNYRNDWDGNDLPAATYYYVIELNDPNNFDAPAITGAVTLVR